MRHDHVALFRSEAAWVQASRTAACVDEARVAPLLLLWEHRLWQADMHGESVTLRPEVGEALQLSGAQVQDLMERGAPRKKGALIGAPKTLARTSEGWSPHPQRGGCRVPSLGGALARGVTGTADSDCGGAPSGPTLSHKAWAKKTAPTC